jgi:hypothetical protein
MVGPALESVTQRARLNESARVPTRATPWRIDGSGRIVVAGTSFSGTNYDFAVVRYLGGSGGCQ